MMHITNTVTVAVGDNNDTSNHNNIIINNNCSNDVNSNIMN